MIAFKSICDALAARFAPGTISTPSGATAMRSSSGQMPKGIAATPAVYIEATHGEVVANTRWEHTIFLDVVFLVAKRPGDPVRVEAERQRWLPALLSATEGQLKLGIGAQSGYEVAKAFPVRWRWSEEHVGGEEYDGIRVTYEVFVYETVSLVA